MNHTTAPTPAEQRKKQVPAGMWGGQHISMDVDAKVATIEYDCGRGTINQPLVLDSRGEFDVNGEHIAEHGGPVRVGPSSGDSRPARYVGRVEGQTMTLTVTMTDTQEEVGTFTLTHGKSPRLVKCK